MSGGFSLTASERQACAQALRHYPVELVSLARNGHPERELIGAGFTQFQVSAVIALLTKARVLPRPGAARRKVSAEGLR